MTRRGRVFASAVWLAASGAVLAQGSLPPGAGACVARLADAGNADETGSARPPSIGEVCPDVAEALQASAWGSSLTGEAEALSANAFLSLVALAGRYDRASPPGLRPSTAELEAVVTELQPFEPLPALSLWDRLMRWLQERLGYDGADGNRLVDWLKQISVPERIVYALGLGSIAAILLIAFNELRRGSVLGYRFRAERNAPGGAARAGREVGVRSLDDLERAPPAKQPALLLRLVVDRLRRRFAGLIRDSSTHRDLARAGGRLSPAQSAALRDVAVAAERATFGAWRPASGDLADVLAKGRTLLRDLATDEGADA